MDNIETYLSEILEIPKEAITTCSGFYVSKKVAKNQFLLREGEICLDTFFVEKGLLRMFSLDKNGKEHVIQFAPENWLISDRSSLNFNEKSKFYIEAIEDTEVFILGNDFFTKMIENYPHIAERNDLLLQKHIRNLQNRVNSLLADTAEER